MSTQELTPPPSTSLQNSEGEKARKGTLQYTKLSLILLFFFLLWGDFVLTMMETVVPKLLPLQLKELGASNTVMAVLVLTLPSVFNLIVNPTVSFQSDNFRSAWGRRIPYLMVVTPVITVLLIIFAFAPEIGRSIQATALGQWMKASPNTCIIAVMAGLLVLFQTFNFCLQPIYYYLFVDVVPDAYMARFMALFRIVGAVQAYLFNSFIYGHALTHTRIIYIGCALSYFVGFMAICLWVREGEYPPPVHSKMGFKESVKTYFRECFSHPHYIYFNLRNACTNVAYVVGMYEVFVARDELGIPLDFIGKINGWTSLILILLLYPMGMLCDRFNSVRMILLGMILSIWLPLGKFFWMHDQSTFVFFSLVGLPLTTLVMASEMPFFAVILPRERFGQFGSANQVVTSLVAIGGSIVAGKFMDWVTAGGTIIANYRYLYFWVFITQLAALIFMTFLYKSWLKYGGSKYTPPASWVSQKN